VQSVFGPDPDKTLVVFDETPDVAATKTVFDSEIIEIDGLCSEGKGKERSYEKCGETIHRDKIIRI